MGELVVLYCVFAITTGLVANYELVSPVFAELSEISPEHNMLEYRWISYLVFTIINVVMAPAVIFPCLIPTLGNHFKLSLLDALASS